VFLYFGCLVGIAWNEMQAVCTSKALEAARTTYEEIDCESKGPGPGGLAHISCPFSKESFRRFTPVDFGSTWLDGGFQVDAVRVEQTVRMLQCQEEKHEREEAGDGNAKRKVVTYTYKLVWSDSLIDSSRFKGMHDQWAGDEMRNGCGQSFRGNRRPAMALGTQVLATRELKMGDFDVSKKIAEVPLDADVQLASKTYSLPGEERRIARDGLAYSWSEFASYYGDRATSQWREARRLEVRGGGSSLRTCESREEVGCLEISYRRSTATHGAYVGRIQSDRRLRAWEAPAHWMCSAGQPVEFFKASSAGASELIGDAQAANTAMLWVIRGVCTAFAILGVCLILQPIQAAADVVQYVLNITSFIPLVGDVMAFLGDAISGAVGCAICTIAWGIGFPSALLVLSFFFALMRPMLALPMLLGSLGVLYFTYQKMVAMAEKTRRSKSKKL